MQTSDIDGLYEEIENMRPAHKAGLDVHVETLVEFANMSKQFLHKFAEWLYEKEPTESQILSNLRTFVYLTIVDGSALYKAITISTSERLAEEGAKAEGYVTVDDERVENLRNDILSYATDYPDMYREIRTAILTTMEAEHLQQHGGMFDEEAWDWYNSGKEDNDGN